MLTKQRRIDLNLGAQDVREALNVLQIVPLTLEVARVSCELDFNADPADQLIAATSIVHAAPLMTRDVKIRRSQLEPLA